MITFFTTFKKYSRAEKNAVNSWLALNDQIEVIIFTETEHTDEWGLPERVSLNRNFQKHETGLPILNAIFAEASRRSNFPLLCYCNSDIIVLPEFIGLIQPLIGSTEPFLAVSQRIDVDVDFDIDYSDQHSIIGLKERIRSKGKIHPPLGSDIFLFPRNQYDEQNMAPLVVGRPTWDNWMLYDARLRFNRLVDMTDHDPKVVHQNHPFYYNPCDLRDQVNVSFLPSQQPYTFVLEYCNYAIRNFRLKKNKPILKDVNRIRWEMLFNKENISYYYFYFLFLINKIKYKLFH